MAGMLPCPTTTHWGRPVCVCRVRIVKHRCACSSSSPRVEMRLYDVPAPAKLNLFLHVVGRRADGYHLLQTAFRFIDLNDTLDFERRDDGCLLREGEEIGR